jgi:beta-lactamase regulating signal transducer with metallopeptidase domain
MSGESLETVGRAFRPGASQDLPPAPTSVGVTSIASVPVELTTAAASPLPMAPTWTMARTLTLLWTIGVVALVLRAFSGVVGVRRLARRASPAADMELSSALARAAERLQVRRPITLLVARGDAMPMTWGSVRPRILLPSSAHEWARERPALLDAVLLHEVAHVARMDAFSRAIAQISVAVFWFNPLFWLAARQARLERERACDDAVLASGMRATDYARDLVALVASSPEISIPSSGALAMAWRSQIERRIESILDGRVNRCGVSRWSAGVAAVVVIAMAPISVMRLVARPAVVAENFAVGDDVALPMETRIDQDMEPTTAPLPSARVTPPPPEQAQRPPIGSPDEQWRAERAEMFAQLMQHARKFWQDSKSAVNNGKMAGIDLLQIETSLVNLEVAAANERNLSRSLRRPSDAEVAALETRFAAALKNLEATETRIAEHSPDSYAFGAAMLAARGVLSDAAPAPAPPQQAQTAIAAPEDKARQEFAAAQLVSARDALAALRQRGISASHPDAIVLQRIIADLEAKAAETASKPAAPVTQTPISADEKWRADRAEMFNTILARARQHLADAIKKTEIGTMASIELPDLQSMVIKVDVAATRDRDQSKGLSAPPEANVAAMKARFGIALANLDASKYRWDLGISSVAMLNEWTTAAVAVLTDPASSAVGGPGWDAVLLASLRDAAKIPDDKRCADILVALAKDNALTPEMVRLYVAAANLIVSPAERARVFAQPIRVK